MARTSAVFAKEYPLPLTICFPYSNSRTPPRARLCAPPGRLWRRALTRRRRLWRGAVVGGGAPLGPVRSLLAAARPPRRAFASLSWWRRPSPVPLLSRLTIQHRNRLLARVQVTTYNRISGSIDPSAVRVDNQQFTRAAGGPTSL